MLFKLPSNCKSDLFSDGSWLRIVAQTSCLSGNCSGFIYDLCISIDGKRESDTDYKRYAADVSHDHHHKPAGKSSGGNDSRILQER